MPEQIEIVRIYSDGERREQHPFEGWVHFTEYRFDEDGISQATGVNPDIEAEDIE